MTTVGNATLAGVTIMQTTKSGFDRPSRLVITQLLDDGSDAPDSVVLQSSSLGIRSADIGFLVDEDDDLETIRDARRALSSTTYVDDAGDSWTVIISDLSTTRNGSRLWECTAHVLIPPATGS